MHRRDKNHCVYFWIIRGVKLRTVITYETTYHTERRACTIESHELFRNRHQEVDIAVREHNKWMWRTWENRTKIKFELCKNPKPNKNIRNRQTSIKQEVLIQAHRHTINTTISTTVVLIQVLIVVLIRIFMKMRISTMISTWISTRWCWSWCWSCADAPG